MSTEAVSAPAPAEAPAIAPEAVQTEKPISVGDEVNAVEKQKAEAKEPEPKKPVSTREAIQKAREKVEAEQKDADKPKPVEGTKADEKGKQPETKEPASAEPEKPAQDRSENGQFKGKESAQAEAPKVKAPHDDAPRRFDDAAKAEWAKAPESVRGAVHRTVTELEKGIEEHQKRWEPLKQYDDIARQSGTTLHEGLERYVAFDRHLSQDLFGGLEGVIRDKTGGQYGLHDIAAHVLGQQPDQAQSQSDATIAELRGQIAQLTKMVGGLGGHMRQQAETTVGDQVIAFAKEKADFEDLAPQIAEHIRAGKTLEEAYTQAKTDMEALANRLGFVRPSAPAQTRIVPDPAEAQTLERGQKSIAGAPGAGSTAATRPPSPSIRDAVRRAMQQAS